MQACLLPLEHGSTGDSPVLGLLQSTLSINPCVVSPTFLFALADCLLSTELSETPLDFRSDFTLQPRILPIIIRGFRWWRVLSLAERTSLETLRELASHLSSLTRSELHRLAPTVQTEPTIAPVPQRATPFKLPTLRTFAPTISYRFRPLSECAGFRNGCGACRHVRQPSSGAFGVSNSSVPPPRVNPLNPHSAAPITAQKRKALGEAFEISPRKRIRVTAASSDVRPQARPQVKSPRFANQNHVPTKRSTKYQSSASAVPAFKTAVVPSKLAATTMANGKPVISKVPSRTRILQARN